MPRISTVLLTAAVLVWEAISVTQAINQARSEENEADPNESNLLGQESYNVAAPPSVSGLEASHGRLSGEVDFMPSGVEIDVTVFKDFPRRIFFAVAEPNLPVTFVLSACNARIKDWSVSMAFYVISPEEKVQFTKLSPMAHVKTSPGRKVLTIEAAKSFKGHYRLTLDGFQVDTTIKVLAYAGPGDATMLYPTLPLDPTVSVNPVLGHYLTISWEAAESQGPVQYCFRVLERAAYDHCHTCRYLSRPRTSEESGGKGEIIEYDSCRSPVLEVCPKDGIVEPFRLEPGSYVIQLQAWDTASGLSSVYTPTDWTTATQDVAEDKKERIVPLQPLVLQTVTLERKESLLLRSEAQWYGPQYLIVESCRGGHVKIKLGDEQNLKVDNVQVFDIKNIPGGLVKLRNGHKETVVARYFLTWSMDHNPLLMVNYRTAIEEWPDSKTEDSITVSWLPLAEPAKYCLYAYPFDGELDRMESVLGVCAAPRQTSSATGQLYVQTLCTRVHDRSHLPYDMITATLQNLLPATEYIIEVFATKSMQAGQALLPVPTRLNYLISKTAEKQNTSSHISPGT